MVRVAYLFCAYCYDLKEDHDDLSGECHAVHGMTGPADNMDVWEEDCDCSQYEPEPGARIITNYGDGSNLPSLCWWRLMPFSNPEKKATCHSKYRHLERSKHYESS